MAVKMATRHEEQLPQAVEKQDVCHHHWMVEDADGPVSRGICRLCGARKYFPNYLSDCLQATEEEYETWLAKQRDYSKSNRTVEKTPTGA